MELTGGRGVDVVLDVVGGDVFIDSLRVLAPQGRLLVVGFAAGQGIPEVKVNRLLLNNVDVRGVGWGAYAMVRPGLHAGAVARPRAADGRRRVKPPIGATYPLEDFGQALVDMDERRTLGKSVVRLRSRPTRRLCRGPVRRQADGSTRVGVDKRRVDVPASTRDGSAGGPVPCRGDTSWGWRPRCSAWRRC